MKTLYTCLSFVDEISYDFALVVSVIHEINIVLMVFHYPCLMRYESVMRQIIGKI